MLFKGESHFILFMDTYSISDLASEHKIVVRTPNCPLKLGVSIVAKCLFVEGPNRAVVIMPKEPLSNWAIEFETHITGAKFNH